MNFFQSTSANPNATFETIEKQRVPFYKGTQGLKPPLSEETRRKISLSAKGKQKLGQRHSEETRKKISAASKLRRHSEQSRKKMSESQKSRYRRNGYCLSEEHRLKISKTMGRPYMTPLGVFNGVEAFAREVGVNAETVRKWSRQFPEQLYYIEAAE